MIARIGEMLMGRAAAIGVVAGMTGLLVVLWQADRAAQKRIGVLTERAETNAENRRIVDRARTVRERVVDERVRGVVDPHAVAK